MDTIKMRNVNKHKSRQGLPSQLRLWRTITGLSQDELSFRTGIDSSRISRIERGYGSIRFEEILIFSGVFGVPPDILFPSDETQDTD
jgi:transcriptional regulator with XRE-family HTH domain